MDYLFQFLIGVFYELWPFKIIRPWERGLLVIAGGGSPDGYGYYRFLWWKFRINQLVLMGPGLWIRIPLLMDWDSDIVTEEPCDLPHQYLQTMDASTVGVSGRLTYEIVDMRTLYLTIHDHEEWLTTVAMGLLSEYIQQAKWDDIDSDDIAEDLLPKLHTEAARVGLQVRRFEITHLSELGPHYLVHDGISGGELG